MLTLLIGGAAAVAVVTGGVTDDPDGASRSEIVGESARVDDPTNFSCPSTHVFERFVAGRDLPSGAVAARSCQLADNGELYFAPPKDILTQDVDALVTQINASPVLETLSGPDDAVSYPCGQAGAFSYAFAFAYPDGTIRVARTEPVCGSLLIGDSLRGVAEDAASEFADLLRVQRRSLSPGSLSKPPACPSVKRDQEWSQISPIEPALVLDPNQLRTAKLCVRSSSTQRWKGVVMTTAQLQKVMRGADQGLNWVSDTAVPVAVIVARTSWGDPAYVAITQNQATTQRSWWSPPQQLVWQLKAPARVVLARLINQARS